jgi:hypothetical protein
MSKYMNACPLKTLNQCVALTFIKTGHVAACTQYKDQTILTVWDVHYQTLLEKKILEDAQPEIDDDSGDYYREYDLNNFDSPVHGTAFVLASNLVPKSAGGLYKTWFSIVPFFVSKSTLIAALNKKDKTGIESSKMYQIPFPENLTASLVKKWDGLNAAILMLDESFVSKLLDSKITISGFEQCFLDWIQNRNALLRGFNIRVPKVPKKAQDYETLPQCDISDETAQRLTDRLLAFPKKFWPRQSIYYLFKNGIINNNNSKRGIMHPIFEASDLEMAMNCLHLPDLSDEEFEYFINATLNNASNLQTLIDSSPLSLHEKEKNMHPVEYKMSYEMHYFMISFFSLKLNQDKMATLLQKVNTEGCRLIFKWLEDALLAAFNDTSKFHPLWFVWQGTDELHFKLERQAITLYEYWEKVNRLNESVLMHCLLSHW